MIHVNAYEVHGLFVGKEGNFHLSRFLTKQIFRHWINETPTDWDRNQYTYIVQVTGFTLSSVSTWFRLFSHKS